MLPAIFKTPPQRKPEAKNVCPMYSYLPQCKNPKIKSKRVASAITYFFLKLIHSDLCFKKQQIIKNPERKTETSEPGQLAQR
jgi:hypothetical protein